MKKLMVIAAVAFAAVASQAATATWGSGQIKNADGTALSVAKTSTTLYLLTSDQYADLGKAVGEATGNAASKIIYDQYNGKSGAAELAANTVSKGSMTTKEKTQTVYNVNDWVYSVIIYTGKNADGEDMFIANMASWEFTGSANKPFSNMGVSLGGGSTADIFWQSVPEPTSGLLLLLGVAGLALRRRRA